MKFSDWWLKRARIPSDLTMAQIKQIQDVAREAYNTGVRTGKKANEDNKQTRAARDNR